MVSGRGGVPQPISRATQHPPDRTLYGHGVSAADAKMASLHLTAHVIAEHE
jgi:hypothetical protein